MMCDAVYCINQDSRQNTQNKKGRTIKAQRKKAAFSLILVVLMAMWLTVNVFAATLNGNVASAPIGGRTYSAYNTITVSGNNARAGTSEDCNVVCAAGHLAVYPILQDIHGILLSSGCVYNTTTTNWFNARTSLYSATSGTLTCFLALPRDSAASISGIATLTLSQPASASSSICLTSEEVSLESTFVID